VQLDRGNAFSSSGSRNVQGNLSEDRQLAKYLMRQGLTADDVCASAVFETHDDELILMALENGLCVRAPDGFASALSGTGHSKHLILKHLEGWGASWKEEPRQRKKLEVCEYLGWLGVPMLVTGSDYDVR
jgi:hypothetical protein